MTYDAIIIGFGKGGKTLATALANKGQKVALIAQDAMMYGGTCINVGCIPSKRLVHASRQTLKLGEVSFQSKQEAYVKAIGGKNELTAMLRQKNYQKQADNPNITVMDGKASFVSNHQVQVRCSEGTTQLTADKIFINTGSMTVMPPPSPGCKTTPMCMTARA